MTKQPKLPLRVRRYQALIAKIGRLEKRREVAIRMLVGVETTLPKLRAQRKRLEALLLMEGQKMRLEAAGSIPRPEPELIPPKETPVESLPPPITPEAVRKAKMKAMGFRPTKPRRSPRPSPAERRPD